jgi:hypothetical protein
VPAARLRLARAAYLQVSELMSFQRERVLFPVKHADRARVIASAARGHLVPIRADRNLAFQGFVDVADVLKRLNFTKVAVQTQTVSR